MPIVPSDWIAAGLAEDDVVIRLHDIRVTFRVGAGSFLRRRAELHAVSGVSLKIRRGETYSIVGESGSGKSTLGRVMCGLLQPSSGRVEIAQPRRASESERPPSIQVVFQDPFSALNPRMTVRSLLEEPLITHRLGNAASRGRRVAQLLDMVGLSQRHLGRYPHEFSGGQRQRIAIARAIAINPQVLLADEPLSALDVSVQAQIINLLRDLKEELGLTLIMISHDLSVVSYISDRIGVMRAGEMVETGNVGQIFDSPSHPYTRSLLDAVPHPDPRRRAHYLSGGAETSPDASAMQRSDDIEAPYAARLRHYAERARAAQEAKQTAQGDQM